MTNRFHDVETEACLSALVTVKSARGSGGGGGGGGGYCVFKPLRILELQSKSWTDQSLIKRR